jgi:hypothetical protein
MAACSAAHTRAHDTSRCHRMRRTHAIHVIASIPQHRRRHNCTHYHVLVHPFLSRIVSASAGRFLWFSSSRTSVSLPCTQVSARTSHAYARYMHVYRECRRVEQTLAVLVARGEHRLRRLQTMTSLDTHTHTLITCTLTHTHHTYLLEQTPHFVEIAALRESHHTRLCASCVNAHVVSHTSRRTWSSGDIGSLTRRSSRSKNDAERCTTNECNHHPHAPPRAMRHYCPSPALTRRRRRA